MEIDKKKRSSNQIKLEKKRITLRCILGRVEESFQKTIYKGINDISRERDINIIYYSGRPLIFHRRFEAFCDIIFDLINPDIIDGIISVSGVFHSDISQNKYLNLLKKNRDLPLISISVKLENHHRILIDNQKGTYDAIMHLIKVHGCRHIAFIKGPEGHYEAELRFKAYKKALTEREISYNPALVSPGNFEEKAGIKAIQLLLDERKVKFDAIMAINDNVALGALLALQKRKINVPKDVAIIGFDNSINSKISNPPLTTIHQSPYLLGKKATEILLNIINGQEVSKEIIIPTELIIRRSCGCFSKIITNASIPPLDFQKRNKPKLNEFISSVLKKSINPILNPKKSKSIEVLHNAFIIDINQNENYNFLSKFDDILRQSVSNKENLNQWYDFISKMRSFYAPYLLSQNKLFLQTENLWHQSRILIGETIEREKELKNYIEERNSLRFLSSLEYINMGHELPKLKKRILEELPLLGIRSCYISLFDDIKTSFEWAKMVIGFDDRGVFDITNKSPFPSSQLIPEEIYSSERRYEWIVEALRLSNENQIGFIVFELQKEVGAYFGRISNHISAALQGALIFEERESLLKELTRSNIRLEEFASIVSHDLKSPIHTIIGYLTLFKEQYKKVLDDNAIETIETVLMSTHRMNYLINDILKYSHILKGDITFQEIDCNHILEKVLINLNSSIQDNKANITYEILPKVIGNEIELIQLFQNLIDNAIKFHSDVLPKVHISCNKKGKMNIFSIKDNGIGIDPIHFKEIFEIFKRLHSYHEYPGSGVGLAICKKIVEHHSGEMWIESEKGKGTTFFFSLQSINS